MTTNKVITKVIEEKDENKRFDEIEVIVNDLRESNRILEIEESKNTKTNRFETNCYYNTTILYVTTSGKILLSSYVYLENEENEENKVK
jgi:hypothetical protein